MLDMTPRNRPRELATWPTTRLRDEIDSLFNRFLREPWTSAAGLIPRLDMTETDENVEVRVDLPGVRPEDVQIDVTGNVLTIRGERRCETEESDRGYNYCEREFGAFTRTIQLPAGVDSENVDANFQDGVLRIALPKRPEARPRRVEIRGAQAGRQPVKTAGAKPQPAASPGASAP